MNTSSRNLDKKHGANILTDQVIASALLAEFERKREELAQEIGHIAKGVLDARQDAFSALNEALGYVNKVRDFAAPQNLNQVLGSMKSKHGEIAEQVEVQISNARAVLQKLAPVADIESVGRTAPEDYIINGIPVQSKFIAGFNKSLDHVLEHISKYPDFAKDATAYGYLGKAGIYNIPKDQYETITKILHGDTGEFNHKTVQACRNFVQEIEEKTGHSFTEVVRPSISNYRDVQIGTIDRTLDGYEAEFKDFTDDKIENIRTDARERIQEAQEAAGPSIGGAAQAGAVGAAIGGVVSGSLTVYRKIKDGKRITEFTVADWKEVGVDFGKGAAKGGISGLGIYGLTQLAGFSAPFAGATVSAGIGVASLAMDYRAGRISREDFADAACSLCVETGLSAVGTALGTALIPIPVIGSVVGAMTAKAAIVITEQIIGTKEKELSRILEQRYNDAVAALSREEQEVLAQINAYYTKLNGLIEAAMDKDVTMSLYASIDICRHVGIAEEEVIHTTDELDDFMLS